MHNNQPLVTIIITTFRRAEFLLRALVSAAAQTYRPIEILVVNEPTPGDKAEEVVGQFIKDHPGTRVCYTEIKGRGISAARNNGVRKAEGEYIVFLDDDDELLPNYTEFLVKNFLAQGEKYAAFGAQPILVDEQGKISRGKISTEPFWSCVIGNGWIFRKQLFAESNLWFDETLEGHEDWDFSLRFFSHYRAMVLPEVLWKHAINLPKFHDTEARSLSSDPAREYGRFVKLLNKHFNIFEVAGNEAVALVNFLAGTKAGEAHDIVAARAYFKKSWRAKFSYQAFLYWFSTYAGYPGFIWLHVFKSRLMRGWKVMIASGDKDQK